MHRREKVLNGTTIGVGEGYRLVLAMKVVKHSVCVCVFGDVFIPTLRGRGTRAREIPGPSR